MYASNGEYASQPVRFLTNSQSLSPGSEKPEPCIPYSFPVRTLRGQTLQKTGLALLVGLVATTPAWAQDSAEQIARAYIAAYEAQDFDAMRAFYAPDARFIDPTSFEMDDVTPDIDWTGADEILAGISSWGVASGVYNFDRVYEASGRVVFDAEMDVVYATPEGEVTYRYPIITILTIEDGQVVEHRDYTGFNEMYRVEGN